MVVDTTQPRYSPAFYQLLTMLMSRTGKQLQGASYKDICTEASELTKFKFSTVKSQLDKLLQRRFATKTEADGLVTVALAPEGKQFATKHGKEQTVAVRSKKVIQTESSAAALKGSTGSRQGLGQYQRSDQGSHLEGDEQAGAHIVLGHLDKRNGLATNVRLEAELMKALDYEDREELIGLLRHMASDELISYTDRNGRLGIAWPARAMELHGRVAA